MNEPLTLIYEGPGFSGTIDLRDWIPQANGDDMASLMGMILGTPYQDASYGIKGAYDELSDHPGRQPDILIFRDQKALLAHLKDAHPLLWEAASGMTLRCDDTLDMFG